MNESYIVKIENLEFGYSRKETILKKLSMSVQTNSIFGLLGSNGEGKTTLIKCILGILKPRKGNISIFSSSLDRNRSKILLNIGSLVESPSLYGHLSGLENLMIFATYLKIDNNTIEKVILQLDMQNFIDKKCKNYSTGMKQRLGIALALLRNPTLLILDEPTNGLDPNGIADLRTLLKQLNSQGITIIISSHLLSEIEKIASYIGIIKNGSCTYNGTIENFTKKEIDLETKYLQDNGTF